MYYVEVEFTYLVTVTEDQHAALSAACDRATTLNPHVSGYQLSAIHDGKAFVAIRSAGHDRSQITRRIVAPIRSIFVRAKIPAAHVKLISSLLVPTKRNLTLAEGRTPQGTFTDPALRQMLDDYAATFNAEQPATGE